jgi:hypothetical protein
MSPAAQTLEGRTGVLIECVLDLRPAARHGLGTLVEISQEELRRQPARFLSGSSADFPVGGDDPDLLLLAVLGGKTLDKGVGLVGEADR